MPTIKSLLLDANAAASSRVALQWKTGGKWKTMTFGELYSNARAVSEAAGRLGVNPGDRVGLMMENRPEWIVVYLGLACCGITVVPIDAKLRVGELSHILRDSGACAIFAGGKFWPTVREIEDNHEELRRIVILDNVLGNWVDGGKERQRRHYDYNELLESVRTLSESPMSFFDKHSPTEDTVASIIYTSGTTGRPKGAMLTHGNFMAQISGALKCFKVRTDDNFLLVLPLHHAFAFTANFIVPLACQCKSSFVENLRTIPENMREVSPTVLLAVPLLADKMLAGVMSKLKKSSAARLLMWLGMWRILGRKVIDGLGGKLRILICGGAASDPATLRAFTRFGIKTLQGYGLTETAPICALSPEDKIKLESVGCALPGNELRISDKNADGVGEIQVRGPVVMKGYFRNEAATAEVFEDGWFCTGDLGKMDSDGYVTITGRKKSLIVNREGKNIYPEEVELAINMSPYILESLVLGYHVESERGERVGAIVVPDMDYIAKQRRTDSDTLTDEEIVTLCRDEVHKMGNAISEYKRPRKLQVRFEPLERTTTHKIKRYLYSLDSVE